MSHLKTLNDLNRGNLFIYTVTFKFNYSLKYFIC